MTNNNDITLSVTSNPTSTNPPSNDSLLKSLPATAVVVSTMLVGLFGGVVVNGNGNSTQQSPVRMQSTPQILVNKANEHTILTSRSKYNSVYRRNEEVSYVGAETSAYYTVVDAVSEMSNYGIPAIFRGTETLSSTSRSVSFDFHPAYGNMKLEVNENLEGIDMNNRFFDVLGERLYKSGFILFGTGSIVLLILWMLDLLSFEVGFVGFLMSLVAVTLLGGMKFLFGRFSRWV
ncbi:MAG: hypothetical protein LKI04_29200 [Paenibacillus lautus]|jgi:hypothetical protein|uniref:hypothetical protein n=1 Tax=Paenibacillus lautus TaxID=1401 RepID=UPI0011A95F29|nr:hypothetical protein [Paenibacillus lautus]MCI1778099.1 hypothetical protein [Paenibacillus lautus]